MEAFDSLRHAIRDLEETQDLLNHRLHTVQAELAMQTFCLADMPLKVKKGSRTKFIRKLLALLELQEEGLMCGTFLHALNVYLVHNGYVDLNDLCIYTSPLISMAFQIPVETQKIPYARLLKSLPELFE